MSRITSLQSREILDSRGSWTIEATVGLEDGSIGKSSVPSGASVGKLEAVSVSAKCAVELLDTKVTEALVGQEAGNQWEIDSILLELDGTKNKRNLGANTTLAASLAVCKAAAQSRNQPLYLYIDSLFEPRVDNFFIPTPLLNVLNGGKHADNDLDFQEFIIIPSGIMGIEDQLALGVLVYHQLEKLLTEEGCSTELGDEGGFAPQGVSNLDALAFLEQAIQLVGVDCGKEISLGIDAAGGELTISAIQLSRLYSKIAERYPLEYLEDPFGEDDIGEWSTLKQNLPKRTLVIGDDLTVTNSIHIEQSAQAEAIDGVIIKPNQIGTLTETLKAVETAKKYNLKIAVSHRSGETLDTFIADLAVGIGANYIKTGAPARGERVAKYNRLMEIEKEQG